MSTFMVYIWTRLDYLQWASITVATLWGIAALFIIMNWGLGDIDEDVIKTFYRKNKKKVIGTLVVPLFIIFLVPDKTDFATIYVVPKITSQEFVTKTLPEMYEVIKKEIKELQK